MRDDAMGYGDDIIVELIEDQWELEEILGELETLPTGDGQRKVHTNQATIELVRHFVTKEELLYPAMRQNMDDGEDLANRSARDQARTEHLLRKLEEAEPGSARFDRLTGRLLRRVRTLIKRENDDVFFRVRDGVPKRTLTDLGAKARRVKTLAPAHPYPNDRRQLSPGKGMVDRVRFTASRWDTMP
jgi:hypothetical protein